MRGPPAARRRRAFCYDRRLINRRPRRVPWPQGPRINGEAGETPAQSRSCIRPAPPPGARGRESGRQPARDVQPPRVKGNGISMTPRLRLPSTLLLFVALLLAACAPAGSGSPTATTLPSASSAAPSLPAHSVYPPTPTDDAGREVTNPPAPARIPSP